MEAKDVAVWIGIASSIAGVAVGYGTLTEKVSTLEKSTDATHLESRLTKLEVRSEDADLGHISKEIQQVRGENEKLAQRVNAIVIPSTSGLKADIRVLRNQVGDLQKRSEDLDQELDKLKTSNKPLL